MKVLFVCRKIPFYDISPIMTRQGTDLINLNINITYFAIDGKGTLGYLKNIFKLRKYLKSNQYDILHAHYGLCGFVTSMASRNEKLVLSFMGSELIESKKNAMKLKIPFIFIHLMNLFCIKTFDFIIVKSKQMADLINDKKIAIIPNGVCIDDFYPISKDEALQKLNLNSKKSYVLFISDPPNRPEKNIELAKSSIDILNRKGLNIEMISLHSVKREILNMYYSATDTLLLTSLHEGSPNVVKEAMSCNCPIVSTNVGDVKENINNIEGCYITNYEPLDVAEKIEKAVKFRNNFKFTSGRESLINKELTGELVANKIKNIYTNILNNN